MAKDFATQVKEAKYQGNSVLVILTLILAVLLMYLVVKNIDEYSTERCVMKRVEGNKHKPFQRVCQLKQGD